ncbi:MULTISPECIES: LysE family translocator [unclassified Neptuniibacter]|uniref:LysE family translocator n=1 Tax=unclassified Neptuniibacter TaxID=2630693 RepID=UPI000C39ECDB|nr:MULTISPECIES: LysE family translocator [unclassified Neptuniibacter]MAY43343.1 homoserine lactone transporter [Oceanospirillaceae bacterium]|tara:strand:+ start:6414 stop:7067 length:654 start_codon:yes stop_codon:yes gene_type:complete
MSEIITFSFVALLLVMSPGPNGALIIKTASRQGRRASFSNIAGLFIATFCHGALSIFGLSAIMLQSAELFFLIKLIGAAYLFYVGFKAIYYSFKTYSLSDKQKITEHSLKPKKRSSLGGGFGSLSEGFFTQLLNPKVSMFYMAAFPQFMGEDGATYATAFILVTIHASIIAAWFISLTLAIDIIKQRSNYAVLGKWVQRISGSVMIYFSGLLLTQKT